MKIAYICSPYRGNWWQRIRNRAYARKITRLAIEVGFAPITPHLYITQVVNENIPKERERGLAAGLDLLDACNIVICGTKYGISAGMRGELKKADEKEIHIITHDELKAFAGRGK